MFMEIREKIIEKLLLVAASVAAVSVIAIIVFVVADGLPAIVNGGIGNFFLSDVWRPTNGSFGILGLIVGSMGVTLLALIIGIPTGIATAVFLADILPARLASIFKWAVELLAGIPSVVYGFFGLTIIIPVLRNITGAGFSMLAGGLILSIMILPTVISLSEDAIASVPESYRQASLAIGANKCETMLLVVIPAARSGIVSSVILGMGRAIGETMAVLLITGNVALLPDSILSPVATLTGTIALEMGYADDAHRQALFALGIILMVIIFGLNMLAHRVSGKMKDV